MKSIQITHRNRVVSGPELETLCQGYEQQHELPAGFFKSRFEKFAKYGDESTAWAIDCYSNFELTVKQVAA